MGYETIVICHGSTGRTRWNGGGRRAIWRSTRADFGNEPRPHQTPKPVRLLKELVRDFSDPGELVIDAMAGSGSTGVACRAMGRRFIGWEDDPVIADRALRRIHGQRAIVTAQRDLFDEVTP
jgi:site-specific DNA-methyltransferase (adenine-specific)